MPGIIPAVDSDLWPELLRPLVVQHGPDAVYRRGLDALGYPPTWALCGSEMLAVRRALQT